MTRLQEFDQYLHYECSGNAWAEVAVDYAQALVEQFEPTDWEELPGLLNLRSEEWRERLYSAITDLPPEVLLPFLLQALPMDVELNAMEDLRQAMKTLASTHPAWQVDAHLYDAILQSANARVGYHARFLREVLTHLQVINL